MRGLCIQNRDHCKQDLIAQTIITKREKGRGNRSIKKTLTERKTKVEMSTEKEIEDILTRMRIFRLLLAFGW